MFFREFCLMSSPFTVLPSLKCLGRASFRLPLTNIFVFITIVVIGLSGGRFSDQKGCCLSSKTREKNVCRGRMIELGTEMARVAEVERGNFVG